MIDKNALNDYIINVEDILDESINAMKEQEIRTELLEEEVNVYLGGCGDVRIGCLIDCIGGGALLTTDV